LTNKPAEQLTRKSSRPSAAQWSEQNVYEGQYVQEGERLFEIADFATMWFQFRAYEQDLPWIKLGVEGGGDHAVASGQDLHGQHHVH
jgi:Cu(I)/Ag(I) efflux system membrane fusion protein